MRSEFIRLFLLLLPIPFVWVLLSAPWDAQGGPLGQLKNTAMDWRFMVRGAMESPIKVVYADVDERTVVEWGERPWNRERFALVAQAALVFGKARTVGYDFIFSSLSKTDMVPAERVIASNQALANTVQAFDRQIVLACSYTGVQSKYMSTPALFPFIYQGYTNSEKNPFPEYPTFPIINDQWGTVAHINPDLYHNAGPVPRWVPMFAKTRGPEFSYNLAQGTAFQFAPVVGELETRVDGDKLMLVTPEGDEMFSWQAVTEHTIYAMALELILQYHGLTHEQVTLSKEAMEVFDAAGEVLYRIPLTEQQLLEVNWFSEWNDAEHNPRVSASDVIAMARQYAFAQSDRWEPSRFGGKSAEEALAEAQEYFKVFEDAVVLVGPVDTTLQDLAPTPFDSSEVPKVGMHGNLIKTIASGAYITRLQWWGHIMITLVLTFLVAALGIYSGRHSTPCKLMSIGLLLGYVAAVFLLFNKAHLVLPLITPVGAAISTSLVGLVYRLLSEEKAKSRIQGMFGTYLSPELVTQMLESGEEPHLGGIEEEITAFFTDVQDFSTFSEQLSPEQLVHLMNEYLTAMTDILMENGCYVDKYIGDAIVGIFNAPVTLENHALKACIATQLLRQRQAELREKWTAESDRWPAIVSGMETRIGLNTGRATVGNMGSEKRFNYTMMGDTVNLAARCESACKSYGVYTMVTGECYDAASASGDEVVFRYLDKIVVKGRSEPARMYEIVCLREALNAQTKECLDIYEGAMEAYLNQAFSHAAKLFEKAAALEPNRKEKNPSCPTTPSEVMLERCQRYQKQAPGEDWDGVYIMESK